jgi:putative redox protein
LEIIMADHVTTTLVDGMHFQVAIDEFIIDIDAAAEVGGVGAGPQPIRLVLGALSGCTGMDVISILRKKRQEITHFSVEVVGTRATEHPKVYTDIEIVYRVHGRGIDPEAVQRAINLSEEKYCPVMGMLRASVNLHSRYEVVEV